MQNAEFIHENIELTGELPFRIFRARTQAVVHSHDCLEINYVERGAGMFLIESEEYEVKEGDFVIVGSRRRHIVIPDESYVSIVIVFDPELLLGHLDEYRLLAPFSGKEDGYASALSPAREEQKLMRDGYYKILGEYEKKLPGWEIVVRSLLAELLTYMYRYHTGRRERGERPGFLRRDYEKIRPAIAYIHKNFREEITLEQLAEQTMLSRSHFEALFGRIMTIRPFTYIQQVRIDYCAGLLLSGDLPVSEAAFRSGFNNLSHFNRKFREAKGMTPREYRKRFGGRGQAGEIRK